MPRVEDAHASVGKHLVAFVSQFALEQGRVDGHVRHGYVQAVLAPFLQLDVYKRQHQLRTLKQARLVKFQRDGKNVIYALSDDHVYTMLAQGMTHICE